MTAAQIGRSIGHFHFQSQERLLRSQRRGPGRRRADALAWRAIGVAAVLAFLALTMMVLALGAAGVATPAAVGHRETQAVIRTGHDHRLEISQDRASALTGAMPVP